MSPIGSLTRKTWRRIAATITGAALATGLAFTVGVPGESTQAQANLVPAVAICNSTTVSYGVALNGVKVYLTNNCTYARLISWGLTSDRPQTGNGNWVGAKQKVHVQTISYTNYVKGVRARAW